MLRMKMGKMDEFPIELQQKETTHLNQTTPLTSVQSDPINLNDSSVKQDHPSISRKYYLLQTPNSEMEKENRYVCRNNTPFLTLYPINDIYEEIDIDTYSLIDCLYVYPYKYQKIIVSEWNASVIYGESPDIGLNNVATIRMSKSYGIGSQTSLRSETSIAVLLEGLISIAILNFEQPQYPSVGRSVIIPEKHCLHQFANSITSNLYRANNNIQW